MKNLIPFLFALAPITTVFGYGNPGKISASLNGDCEIEVTVETLPSPTSTLLECSYEIRYFVPGYGYQYKVLEYVPCDALTMTFDMPDLPANVSNFNLIKKVVWQPTQGTQYRLSNAITLQAHCTPAPVVTPAPPANTPTLTPWQAGNTLTPTGPASAHVSATQAGIWIVYDANGFVLANGPITVSEMDITIPQNNNNSIIYLACYFFFQGEMQVETLTFL